MKTVRHKGEEQAFSYCENVYCCHAIKNRNGSVTRHNVKYTERHETCYDDFLGLLYYQDVLWNINPNQETFLVLIRYYQPRQCCFTLLCDNLYCYNQMFLL